MGKLKEMVVRKPDLSVAGFDRSAANEAEERLSALSGKVVLHGAHADAMKFSSDIGSAAPLLEPFTPDHIVYCKARPMFVDDLDALSEDFRSFRIKTLRPKDRLVKRMGFALGTGEKDAKTAKMRLKTQSKLRSSARVSEVPGTWPKKW